MKRALALLLAGVVITPGLSGCASQTALLLPGEAGHPVGALVVLNKDGSDGSVLNEANESVSGGSSVQHDVKVKPAYTELMSWLPLPYKTFSINFPLGAELPEKNADYFKFLDDVRTEIALRPGAEVQVTGHTDKQGGPNFDNIGLSRKRAEKFREFLIKEANFPADQVSAVGRGSLEPIDANDDAKNRRIEVIVR